MAISTRTERSACAWPSGSCRLCGRTVRKSRISSTCSRVWSEDQAAGADTEPAGAVPEVEEDRHATNHSSRP
jgi:hypothetical protein